LGNEFGEKMPDYKALTPRPGLKSMVEGRYTGIGGKGFGQAEKEGITRIRCDALTIHQERRYLSAVKVLY